MGLDKGNFAAGDHKRMRSKIATANVIFGVLLMPLAPSLLDAGVP
jgi:hypothetical protein